MFVGVIKVGTSKSVTLLETVTVLVELLKAYKVSPPKVAE
jgi:hypothetical protein